METDLTYTFPSEDGRETAKPFDLVGQIMAFESGDLDEGGIVRLFQHLIDTGAAWTLQGSYGRRAQALIEAGICEEAS
jgi:hypothetical protein